MKPIIGITPSSDREKGGPGAFDRCFVKQNYVEAVLAAGGLPVILPYQDDNAAPILELVDGLLFTGGADVEPALYGDEEIHPATYGVNPARDRFEVELIHASVARDTPVLCICRGIQVLNVALGGTLHQHLPDAVGQAVRHRQEEIGIEAPEPSHRLAATAGGRIEAIHGARDLPVNSFHHQAIREPAPGLVIEGRSEDGLIEAVSLPGAAFVLGVQWHPEMMFRRHPEHLAPFNALAAAARARRLTGIGS